VISELERRQQESDRAIPSADGPSPAQSPGAVPHGRFKHVFSFVIGSALFLMALWVLQRWAAHVTLDQLRAELEELTPRQVGLAVVCTFLSFVALAGYEYYAVRYVGRRLPAWKVGLYSFITQSVSHAVGFAIVVGATIRYKLYSADRFSLIEVAKIQVFFLTTFGLGATTLAGGVFLIEPAVLAEATTIPTAVWRTVGAALLLAVGGLLVWGALFHRPLRWLGQVVELPTARITLIQIALGVADLVAVAAALHALMPGELGLTYAETLGIFVAAISIGLISHVPGSLGVFESAVILLVSPDESLAAPLIGALVAFRAVYYMLPLLLGAVSFAVLELLRWVRSPAHSHERA
jgi:uncharacterized membrane protein YbhN (UPF0104 family)